MFDEAGLMCALTLKDIPTFWNNFFRYAYSHKADRMPTHYQEAALLYGNLEKNVDVSKMPFDKSVKLRFQDFMRFAQKHVYSIATQPAARLRLPAGTRRSLLKFSGKHHFFGLSYTISLSCNSKNNQAAAGNDHKNNP
jgi:hypothetical protein